MVLAMPWGDQTYRDREKTPVPLLAERCTSHPAEKRGHGCKFAADHDGRHRCICGKRWT